MCHRDPEHRHHRVADVLVHRSSVALDDSVGILEPAPDQLVQRLRVEPLAEGREPADVREEDRDNLSRPDRRGEEVRKRRAAEGAVSGPRLTRLAAIGARRHARSLSPPPGRSQSCPGVGRGFRMEGEKLGMVRSCTRCSGTSRPPWSSRTAAERPRRRASPCGAPPQASRPRCGRPFAVSIRAGRRRLRETLWSSTGPRNTLAATRPVSASRVPGFPPGR